MSTGYRGVKRLAKEHSNWLPIVKVCLQLAKEDGEFAGKWVLDECQRREITKWFPGLRRLVAYGILKHESTARGGRRAYYSMPDPEGTEKALKEVL